MKRTKLAAKLVVGTLAVVGALGVVGAWSFWKDGISLDDAIKAIKDGSTPL